MQRPQETVEDAPEEMWAERRRQGLIEGTHRRSDGKPTGVLVCLNRCVVAAQRHDLAEQPAGAKLGDVEHRGIGQAGCLDKRAVHPNDSAVGSSPHCAHRSSTSAPSASNADRKSVV